MTPILPLVWLPTLAMHPLPQESLGIHHAPSLHARAAKMAKGAYQQTKKRSLAQRQGWEMLQHSSGKLSMQCWPEVTTKAKGGPKMAKKRVAKVGPVLVRDGIA